MFSVVKYLFICLFSRWWGRGESLFYGREMILMPLVPHLQQKKTSECVFLGEGRGSRRARAARQKATPLQHHGQLGATQLQPHGQLRPAAIQYHGQLRAGRRRAESRLRARGPLIW